MRRKWTNRGAKGGVSFHRMEFHYVYHLCVLECCDYDIWSHLNPFLFFSLLLYHVIRLRAGENDLGTLV